MKSGKSFFEKNEMKEYRYKAPADDIVMAGLCLIIPYYVFFVAWTDIDETSTKIVVGIFASAFLLFAVQIIGAFIATSINVRKIILKEDRVLIPHIYSNTYTTFRFEKITQVESEIRTGGRLAYYSNTLIHIKSGEMMKVEIKRSHMESGAAFNELFDELRNRVEIARKDIPKQVEVDDEHQLYEPPRKITFERGEFFKRRFS